MGIARSRKFSSGGIDLAPWLPHDVQVKRIVFLAMALGGGVSGPRAEEVVQVRPAGVALLWSQDEEKAFDHLAILNQPHPVGLALSLRSAGKKIVSVDEEGSKVLTFADDRGTDLKGEFGYFPQIAEDGSVAILDLHGTRSVSPEAGALIAKGQLKVGLASRTNALRAGPVEVGKGAVLKFADDLQFEITRAGKPEWGDAPFSVSLTIKRDVPEVAAVRFFDGTGKQIEAERAGSSRSGFLGRVSLTWDFTLQARVEQLAAEVDVWSDLEEKVAPFDLRVGIGGAK